MLDKVNANGNSFNFQPLTLTPLTLCPIDTAPIDLSLLTKQEREWLNDYHAKVCEALLPELTDEADRQWLVEATREV